VGSIQKLRQNVNVPLLIFRSVNVTYLILDQVSLSISGQGYVPAFMLLIEEHTNFPKT
jgi:hypothetical protein